MMIMMALKLTQLSTTHSIHPQTIGNFSTLNSFNNIKTIMWRGVRRMCASNFFPALPKCRLIIFKSSGKTTNVHTISACIHISSLIFNNFFFYDIEAVESVRRVGRHFSTVEKVTRLTKIMLRYLNFFIFNIQHLCAAQNPVRSKWRA